jgi:hypothetical protein
MNPKWETQNGILVAPPGSAKRIEALESSQNGTLAGSMRHDVLTNRSANTMERVLVRRSSDRFEGTE